METLAEVLLDDVRIKAIAIGAGEPAGWVKVALLAAACLACADLGARKRPEGRSFTVVSRPTTDVTYFAIVVGTRTAAVRAWPTEPLASL